jgi:formylglycine-generating enzyme required for sulfatase activity
MFAAPEQLRGKAADARTDVYALAASLYYALNFDKPEHREPDQFEPEHVPEALREALTRALHHKPEKRYANAAEFRAALPRAPSPPPHPPSHLHKPGEQLTNSLGMKFAWIPPGTFLMGSPESEEGREGACEGPQHEVTISRPFYLGVYPVTQREYEAVMGQNPSHFGGNPDHPVEKVRWNKAVEFCQRLSALEAERQAGRVYRLPTEAEWEYACRAGTTTPFHFGASASSTQANFDGNYPCGGAPAGPFLQQTAKVGSYPANAWGLYDLHGNVWEWCNDWFAEEYYRKSDKIDPQGPSTGTMRVLRGGPWSDQGVWCRAACRGVNGPGGHKNTYGFRVACSVAAENR